jgi:hypothetical protein
MSVVVTNISNSQQRPLQHNLPLHDLIHTTVTKTQQGYVVNSSPIYLHVLSTHQHLQD